MLKKEAKKRIQELKESIAHYNHKYYTEDISEISDQEYDKLYRELETIEAEFPELLTKDSPTQKIGGVIYNTFAPVVHTVPMESLHDSFSEAELMEFDRRVRGVIDSPEYIVEPKFDGLSVALEYLNGVFIRGSTRGDGVTGEDVTENIRTVRSVPKKLTQSVPFLEVRGEVYMSDKSFDALCERQENLEEKTFKNPRNAAAGSLRQKDPRVTETRELDIFVFNVQQATGESFTHHDASLRRLKELGFTVPHDYFKSSKIEEVIKFINEVGEKRGEVDYPIDGAVVKVNKISEREELGSTAKYPRWAEAFKYPPEEKETTLLEIEVQVGRTGVLTPIGQFEPITLSGTTVSRATLHNQDFISEKGICKGSRVVLRKAGEIIPEIVTVVNSPEGAEYYRLPTHCPTCKEEATRLEGEAATRCNNPQCPAQLLRHLIHFASRDAMDIDGLGPAIIKQLLDEDMLKSPADLYILRAEDLIGLDRFAQKSAENLIASIAKSKSAELNRFIYALGIPHIGTKAAKLLCEEFHTLAEIEAAHVSEISVIDGYGLIMAEAVVDFFKRQSVSKLIQKFYDLNFKLETSGKKKGTRLKGQKFVITGTLPNLSRKEASDLIESSGGKVTGSVSKKTNYLLAGEDPGSKFTKAELLGIEILTEEGLLHILKHKGQESTDTVD